MTTRARGLDGNFWKKVDFGTGCWNWKGLRDPSGYGYFSIPRDHHLFRKAKRKDQMVRASRFAFQRVVGPIPEGLVVCHSCDNPSCVRPEHLFLGTTQENADDKVRKNRQYRPVGEKNNGSSLTEVQVMEIRRRLAIGESGRSLAKEFGVSKGCVSLINTGGTWKHLLVTPRERRKSKKLTLSQAREIRAADALGILGKDLAARYGVSRPVISNILNNKIWRESR